MRDNKPVFEYSAAEAYKERSSAELYEQQRFSSLMGKYRWSREQKAVKSIISELPENIVVADCPSGNGRWWKALSERSSKIVALDVSQEMLDYSASRPECADCNVELQRGNAETLPLADDSVDFVFSHALTKHLPVPVQYNVLAEFSRVARLGVVCSFGVFTHISYEFWRHRHIEESYPVFFEELEWMAKSAGLSIKKMERCTTPIGVENSVLFVKL